MPRWEVRSALRHGSQHEGYTTSLQRALSWAQAEITKHGSVGRIEFIDKKKRIVYYDEFEEMA